MLNVLTSKNDYLLAVNKKIPIVDFQFVLGVSQIFNTRTDNIVNYSYITWYDINENDESEIF